MSKLNHQKIHGGIIVRRFCTLGPFRGRSVSNFPIDGKEHSLLQLVHGQWDEVDLILSVFESGDYK